MRTNLGACLLGLALLAGSLGPLAGGLPAPPPAPAPSPVLQQVDGGVLVATAEGGPLAARCAATTSPLLQGVVGAVLRKVTPGAPFSLRATDANAQLQDLDIYFLHSLTYCTNAEDPAHPTEGGSEGDDAGYVPPDATVALVWLYSGAAASFRYTEFAPPAPATASVDVAGAMGFRIVKPDPAVSLWYDMYEPHLAIGGDGTIYVTGHTAAADTLREPAFYSRDDGATWAKLPDVQDVALPIPEGVGSGDEGGIAADGAGHAWLYGSDWVAGTSFLYQWCGDGATLCQVNPLTFDVAQDLQKGCGPWPGRMAIDKPWARYGHGKVLIANVGIPTSSVDEFRAASMLGLYDPATNTARWNTCVGWGGMPGVPAIRDSDGAFAVPQIVRTADGEGWLTVHHGTDLGAITDSRPLIRAQKSWQECNLFNGYSSFDEAGNYYVIAGTSPTQIAVTTSPDLQSFSTTTFDMGLPIRYLWSSGSQGGAGGLISWAVAKDCGADTPMTFYAAHVVPGSPPRITDASVVVADLRGTCGHYMGNALGPDGRAYLVIHTSNGQCMGPVPTNVPLTTVPWRVFIQDAGPRA